MPARFRKLNSTTKQDYGLSLKQLEGSIETLQKVVKARMEGDQRPVDEIIQAGVPYMVGHGSVTFALNPAAFISDTMEAVKAAEEAVAPAGNAPANTSTPGKRTPSERARLAALARWGKYKGAGKPKPKGRKPAQTPEAKEAARRQAAMDARAKVATEMGISTEDQASLDALAMGKPPGDTAALVKAGIVELGKDGTPRLTAAGKTFYNAAGRGDAGAAGDALSRGKDKAPQPKEDKPAAEAEKPKAGGGGGGGGKEKPTAEDKQTERQAARAKMAADTAGKVGLKDIDALRAARDEGGADSKELRELGLIDDAGDATDQGRRALTALELGNVGTYRAALQDAKGRMAREAAAATRTKDKDARALERAKQAQDKASTATTRRAKEQRGTRVITTRETKDMDYADALNGLLDIADALEPDATKAGSRHNAADRALVQAICDAACDLVEMACALGAVREMDDEEDDEDETAIGETVEMLDDSVKMLSDGRIGGYAVRFGSADEPDLSELRDYFTKSTEFWLDHWATRPMLYHHAQDAATKAAPVVGTWTGATVDNVGVWLEGQLNKAHRYHAAIKDLVQRGMLKLSSDSAPHLVIRERQPNGTNEIKRWPMLAASLTPTPAEPRLMAIDYIKALYAEAGLLPPVEIDDSPEATDADEPVEMAPAMKTGDGVDDATAVELELIEIALLEAA